MPWDLVVLSGLSSVVEKKKKKSKVIIGRIAVGVGLFGE